MISKRKLALPNCSAEDCLEINKIAEEIELSKGETFQYRIDNKLKNGTVFWNQEELGNQYLSKIWFEKRGYYICDSTNEFILRLTGQIVLINYKQKYEVLHGVMTQFVQRLELHDKEEWVVQNVYQDMKAYLKYNPLEIENPENIEQTENKK